MAKTHPKVGDIIYVNDIDIMAGAWIRGGRATVARVSIDRGIAFVEVQEVPGASWNWESLAEDQQAYQSYYADKIAGQRMLGAGPAI